MPIPWDQVILHGPRVLDAATAIFDKLKTRPRTESIDPDSEVKIQLAAMVQRLQVLEEAQTAQAEIGKNMAEQIEGLTAALEQMSRKATLASWIAGVALLQSVLVSIAAFMRKPALRRHHNRYP